MTTINTTTINTINNVNTNTINTINNVWNNNVQNTQGREERHEDCNTWFLININNIYKRESGFKSGSLFLWLKIYKKKYR